MRPMSPARESTPTICASSSGSRTERASSKAAIVRSLKGTTDVAVKDGRLFAGGPLGHHRDLDFNGPFATEPIPGPGPGSAEKHEKDHPLHPSAPARTERLAFDFQGRQVVDFGHESVTSGFERRIISE